MEGRNGERKDTEAKKKGARREKKGMLRRKERIIRIGRYKEKLRKEEE